VVQLLLAMSEERGLSHKDLLEILVARLSEFVIVVADPNGSFSSWHPGVQQQFGYTAQEFLGQSFDILLPEEDRLNGAAQKELDTAASKGRASDTRWLVRKDGIRILVEGVTLALRHAGSVVGFGKVLRDVTEKRNAEDSLRALTRALDQSTVIVRRWEGQIIHWTAGCARLYGWTAKEAVGKKCHELLKSTSNVPYEQIQQELLESGAWKGELAQTTRDGREVTVATHCVLLRDTENEPLNVIETQTDISARLEVQRELEAANAKLKSMAFELERSNEELQEFARIASHDLSAPIISTRWLVDLLSTRNRERLDEHGQKCLRQISQGLDRMSELIDGILAHAHVGTRAIRSSETSDAEEALVTAIESLRKDLETSDAEVTHDQLPTVNIEAHALRRLFQNLLSNSIKYRRNGLKPTIHIAARPQQGMWLLSVADNGIGIEPEWFERIFQPLQRRHGQEISGSGIGLATCRKIVSRAGGHIWVESQVGSGSTFFFTLPGPDESLSAGNE